MKHTARVVPGRGEGVKLGFPTINLEIPEGFDAKHGIYAGWVWLNGEKCPAAFHYGPVPAFGVEKPSLEAHVIGRDIPAAPQELSFELVKYLREIKQFEELDALRAQIQEDVRQAREMLEGV